MLLGLILTACAGAPSMVGFAHPEPVPPEGYEVTAGFGGGGGGAHLGSGIEAFTYYGGELSYAAKLGSLGLSFTGWSAAIDHDIIQLGGHLELAIPLVPGMYGSRYFASRRYLIVGLGGTANPYYLSYRPQISVGFLRAPPAMRSGAFWGARLHGGLEILGGTGESRGEMTGAGTLSGSVGYRWRSPRSRVVPSLQVSPFIDYDTNYLYLAVQVVFALGFQLG